MNAPCDTCANRQRPLYPHGCFHKHGTTDFIGRLEKKLFGCDRYRRKMRI